VAKVIKYKFLSVEVNHGTEENPIVEQIFIEKTMGWNEVNEEIAKKEAYKGEYTIEDDGIEEISEPTWQDKIEAQVTYNSMMLGTLIEEV
jgi:hypothetical protein